MCARENKINKVSKRRERYTWKSLQVSALYNFPLHKLGILNLYRSIYMEDFFEQKFTRHKSCRITDLEEKMRKIIPFLDIQKVF